MRQYVRNSPKQIPQKMFTLDIFGGGLNNVSGDTQIADNESTNNQNMMFISGEQMETRYGTTYVDELDVEDPIIWTDEYKPINASTSLIRATASEVYVGNTKIADVTGNIVGMNYVGKYYFIDGTNMFAYDGTHTYTVKVDPKSYAKTTVTNGSVAPWIELENLDARTTVGQSIRHETATATKTYTITDVDLVNKKIKISETTSAEIAVGDMIRLYTPRAKATYFDGVVKTDETNYYTWYEPCDYELEDSLKGENYIPDKISVMKLKGERFYVSGDVNNPHNIYLSDIANPLYYPALIGFMCPPNGDHIVDIIEFDNAMLVGRHKDWHCIYGNTPDTSSADLFHMERVDAHIGLMTKSSYAILNNFLFFLGYDGKFYRMNTPQTNIEYLMTKPLPYKINLYTYPLNLTENDMDAITTIVYDNKFFMTIGGLVLIYSYENQGFTFFKGWNAKSIYTDGKTVYIGNSTGRLIKWDSSVYSDCGNAIESIYETKRFDMGFKTNFKFFNQCMLTTHAYPTYTTEINLECEVDFYYLKSPKKITSGQSLFGVTNWGDKFTDKEIVKSNWNLLNVRGRTLKLRFSNNAVDQPIRIYDANVAWSLRDFR